VGATVDPSGVPLMSWAGTPDLLGDPEGFAIPSGRSDLTWRAESHQICLQYIGFAFSGQ